MIDWTKPLKMAYDKAEHVILLSHGDKARRSTKYIRSREELSRVEWFLENVWHARFRWVEGVGICDVRELAAQESLAEKRP